MPEAMHVVTGTRRARDLPARRLRRLLPPAPPRFLEAVENRADVYPYPVDHCSLCDFLSLCKARWDEDDHLTLVAGVSRLQVERLTAAEIRTLTALAETQPGTKVKSMRSAVLEGIRHQAELQLHHRRTGEHRVDHLPVEPDRGFSLMPEPSPGRHLARLRGRSMVRAGPRARVPVRLGRARRRRRAAVTTASGPATTTRRRLRSSGSSTTSSSAAAAYPDMHVYHYAPYERTALSRLMGEHGTREDEIDDLLRGEVLVDLFRVTRQALRASLPRYSIKNVEELYGFERHAEIGGGGESVNAFETWLESGDDSLLDGIRDYNEEDCVSLLELHRWLLERRPADLPWRLPPEQRRAERGGRGAAGRARAACGTSCSRARPKGTRAGFSPTSSSTTAARRSRSGGSTSTTRRSTRRSSSRTATRSAGSSSTGEPVPVKQSLEYTFTFPPQEHKIGGPAVDPATERDVQRRGRRRAGDGHAPARASLGRAEPLPTRADPAAAASDVEAARRRCSASPRTSTRIQRSWRSSSGVRRALGSSGRWSTRRSASTGAISSSRARPGRGRRGTARAWRSRS